MKKKLFRITTVPMSLKLLLAGQLKFMSEHYDVTGISSPGPDLEETSDLQGIRTIGVDMSRKITPFKDLTSIYRLYRIFKKEKPFIVHSHTPKAGLAAMTAAFLAGVPHRLHTVAGMPLMESTGIKKIILRAVEKFTYACSTRIYCNSSGLMKYMTGTGLIKPGNVRMTGNGSTNGVDTLYYDRTPEVMLKADNFTKDNGIKADCVTFSFAGRIVADKGMNELISAFNELNSLYKDLKLILVGWLEPDLDPLSTTAMKILGSNKNIISTGYRDDIRPYLAASDVFVFPSYREGFPNTVMQAGSLGLPCIVTDINGCNEIVNDGINGIIVQPKDENALRKAMESFITDPALIKKLSAGARDTVRNKYERKFVWEEMLKEYKGLE